jgi:hypothetical protein
MKLRRVGALARQTCHAALKPPARGSRIKLNPLDRWRLILAECRERPNKQYSLPEQKQRRKSKNGSAFNLTSCQLLAVSYQQKQKADG